MRRVFLFPSGYNTLQMRAVAEFVREHRSPVEVEVREPTRNTDQNRCLHAALSDLARQAEWKGQKLAPGIWKRLCVAAWMRENGQNPMMVPALDGQGFDIIYERTSKLSVRDCSSLTEWIYALGSELGVRFTTKDEP